MNKLRYIILLLAITAGMAMAQKSKKVIRLQVSRELPFAAETVWANVAEDYGAIANAHPKI